MFERKNQNILSEHYSKLIEQGGDDSEDEFLTLKRVDHELNDKDLPESDFVSKRKLKMANSRKALGKYGEKGHKLVFDDEGNPHEIYEMKSTGEVFTGEDHVKREGKKFAEDERLKIREVDIVDKAEAKEKKREKKRKRKEREREVGLRFYFSEISASKITYRLMGMPPRWTLHLGLRYPLWMRTTDMSVQSSIWNTTVTRRVMNRLLVPPNGRGPRIQTTTTSQGLWTTTNSWL